jgi:MPBQ/MSBQ methyltransferase
MIRTRLETSHESKDDLPMNAGPGRGARTATEEPFSSRYDEVIQSPQMRALYGESGYFNVGFWARGATDLVTACDEMVDQLAAAVPPGAGVLLDVGCGLGAGTRRLAAKFPHAKVVGVNISTWQLLQARQRGLRFGVVSDAALLGFADLSADAILACESAQHFHTRAAFLREAMRVLKPGGTIALADMLFHDREPVGSWMLPPENAVRSPQEYGALLGQVGFSEVEVRDVTDVTWIPYCREMQRVFRGHEDILARIRDSLCHYVLGFARKPGRIVQP